MAACLIAVVSGEVYVRYAQQMSFSAATFFPGDVRLVPGRIGWPDATLYRYHALLEEDWSGYDYLYLSDADMLWEAPVGDIFGEIVATEHPGYVGKKDLPYEGRPESTAFVAKGERYYAGGFVGGEREAFLDLCRKMVFAIDEDAEHGLTAVWHDESHLNRILHDSPPTKVLPPSYSYPDDDSGYPWLKHYPRILVALDKTAEERGDR